MNDYVIALLAWIGFSPVAGVAVGTFLRRGGDPRRGGVGAVNRHRPERLPRVVADQLVPVKLAAHR